MKCIEIKSDNLTVKENKDCGVTVKSKGSHVDIVILWNVLTNIITSDKGGKEMLESYLAMDSVKRKDSTTIMCMAYRMSRSMDEFKNLMAKIEEEHNG